MVTTYFRNLVADNVWHTAGTAALPTEYWLALSSTTPLADGTGVTEPDGASGYSRIKLTGLSAASNGATSNTVSLSWPKLNISAGTASYWALFDSKTGGKLLMGDALDSLKHLDAGTTIIVDAKNLTLSVLEA